MEIGYTTGSDGVPLVCDLTFLISYLKFMGILPPIVTVFRALVLSIFPSAFSELNSVRAKFSKEILT